VTALHTLPPASRAAAPGHDPISGARLTYSSVSPDRGSPIRLARSRQFLFGPARGSFRQIRHRLVRVGLTLPLHSRLGRPRPAAGCGPHDGPVMAYPQSGQCALATSKRPPSSTCHRRLQVLLDGTIVNHNHTGGLPVRALYSSIEPELRPPTRPKWHAPGSDVFHRLRTRDPRSHPLVLRDEPSRQLMEKSLARCERYRLCARANRFGLSPLGAPFCFEHPRAASARTVAVPPLMSGMVTFSPLGQGEPARSSPHPHQPLAVLEVSDWVLVCTRIERTTVRPHPANTVNRRG